MFKYTGKRINERYIYLYILQNCCERKKNILDLGFNAHKY